MFRNPQQEAQELLADGYVARVLEPSPPTVDNDEWFADDPTSLKGADPDLIAVTPTTAGEILWDELAIDDPDIAAFAAERWLGAYKELGAIPKRFAKCRTDLHRLAYSVVAEARRRANTKLGLRFTKDGFGTPFFNDPTMGDDVQVRVEGTELVLQQGSEVSRQTITTLSAAARFVGVVPGTDAAEDNSPELGDVEEELIIDEESVAFAADWFGFSTSALEEVRIIPSAKDVSRVQLWPGHFDIAIEMGSAERSQRASYGASLGDDGHEEPYLYVAAFGDVDESNSFWNDDAFSGASVLYSDLLEEPDPREAAIEFFQTGNQLLRGR
ncbi:MAG: hypothetical protein V3V01_01985 [Acidimicrobiales bacterium]